jgi:hypothetical protein
LIAGELLDLDCIDGMQNLVKTGLKNQNLDFKELNWSDRLTCDGYCEAIMRVRIYRAQGQMSQHLADGCEYLWDVFEWGPLVHLPRSPGETESTPLEW